RKRVHHKDIKLAQRTTKSKRQLLTILSLWDFVRTLCLCGEVSYFFPGGVSSTISSDRTQSVFPSPTDVLSITIRTWTLSSAGGRRNEAFAVFHWPPVPGIGAVAMGLYPGVTCTYETPVASFFV